MKLLPPIIHIGSGASRFEYRCLIRKGMHAVYEQWQHGRLMAYEVFRIMSHNGYKIGATDIPAAESMPSSSAWGIHGFTIQDKAKAIRRLAEMIARV